MKNFLFVVFLVSGCATTTSVSTLRASNVDAFKTRNTGALHDDSVSTVDTVQAERDCQEKWRQTLPEVPPTDEVGAEQYARSVQQIIAHCEERGDQGVSIATGQPLQSQRQPIGYGGFLYGTGNVFAGYPASAPYIIPDNRPVVSGGQDVEQLKVDVHDLVRSNNNHHKRIGKLEEAKETP